MNRYQVAEEGEPAKEAGRSPQAGGKNPSGHRITENRGGGHLSQRGWSGRLTTTEASKKQKVKTIQQTDTPTSRPPVTQAMSPSVWVLS